MNINELMNGIKLPNELQEEVNKALKEIPNEAIELIPDLINPKLGEETYHKIVDILAPDEFNFKLLALNLQAALSTYKLYQENHISDKIFFDTMACFTRFMDDHKRRFGFYKFVEGWWTYRQLNFSIFRIGELEYEILDDCISMHIPTDANMQKEEVVKSFKAAKYFLNNHFKNTIGMKAICVSWLLSPGITPLLKPTSHILAFQSMFDFEKLFPEDVAYKKWLFDTYLKTPIEELREDTSLRKKAKELLLNGGKIGEAKGTLKKEYW